MLAQGEEEKQSVSTLTPPKYPNIISTEAHSVVLEVVWVLGAQTRGFVGRGQSITSACSGRVIVAGTASCSGVYLESESGER